MAEQQTVLTDPAPAPAPAPAPDAGKADAGKVDTGKAEQKQEPQRIIPDKYTLKLPDDAEYMTEADLAPFVEEAKSLKLTNEEAQALLGSRSKDRSVFMDRQFEAHAQRVQDWGTSLKKDEEIAGKDGKEYDANVARAKMVISKFGSPELLKALNESGYGNHPELVRLMVRVGKAMKEDSFHSSEGKGSSPGLDKSDAGRASRLYDRTQTK